MKLSKILKLSFTAVWTIIGLFLMNSLTYGPEVIEAVDLYASMDGTIETTPFIQSGHYWYDNFGAFLVFMIPVFAIWLIPILVKRYKKNANTKTKTVKRKSYLS